MSVVIRQARVEDLPYLSELCLRSKAVWGYDPAFLEACRSELMLRKNDLKSSSVGVAEMADDIVGVVQVEVANGEAELLKLFVEPKMLRTGLGRILFSWAVDQMDIMGASRMTIESDPDAAPFYRRMGAHDIGLATSGSIPGRTLPKLAFDLNNGTAK